jgi:hypothetical protein
MQAFEPDGISPRLRKIASVMNILRKSWGVKISGCPAASVSPVRPSTALSMLRMVPEDTCRSSVPLRRCSPGNLVSVPADG